MKLIIASTQDMASINIAHQIMKLYKFEKINGTFQDSPVYEQTVADKEVKLLTISDESTRSARAAIKKHTYLPDVLLI